MERKTIEKIEENKRTYISDRRTKRSTGKRFALEGRSISCLCWTDVRMVRYARLSGKQKSMEQS